MLPQKTMLSLWDSFTALLTTNGISATWLFVSTSIFFLVFLLSLREFLCWYLKIYKTQSMIEELQKEVKALQNNAIASPTPVAQTTTEPLKKESPADRFVHFN